MPTLSEIFDKRKILLYQNESLDLDHYYQEPYQDENDEIKDMGKPFGTDESKKIRTLDLSNEDRTYSGFSYFMDTDGSVYACQNTGWAMCDLYHKYVLKSMTSGPQTVVGSKTTGSTSITLSKDKPVQNTDLRYSNRSKHNPYSCGNKKINLANNG